MTLLTKIRESLRLTGMKPERKVVFSEPSWILRSDEIEMAVTERGGHMAPVVFYRNDNPIDPYYVNPWHAEKLQLETPVLRPLRGNFFCMPFGENNYYKRENHEVHGESATADWSLVSSTREGPVSCLTLAMETKIRPGKTTKIISLVDGQNVVYTQHILQDYQGKMCFGHHATLNPHGEADSMNISTSPIKFGLTNPHFSSQENNGEYYSLSSNRSFKKIEKVPTMWNEYPYDDISIFPRRRGFVDIVQIFAKKKKNPSWTCAVYPKEGFLWYSLKDPAQFPSTVIWMENHGRHQAPWNGRNCCIGLEDVCAYFALGLRESTRKNKANKKGSSTYAILSEKRPTMLNYIEGTAKIPKGFDKVRKIKFGNDEITFISFSEKSVTVPVYYSFLKTGHLSGKEQGAALVIKRSSMSSKQVTAMRGGPGTLTLTDLTGAAGPCKNSRLISQIDIPPGAGIGQHEHNSETEYYIVLEGNGVVHDSGKDLSVGPGDVVITGDGAQHSIRNDADKILKLIAVIITY